MDKNEFDRLEKLAIEVSEAKDAAVPGILLKLKDIISSTAAEDLLQLKLEVWKLDLLQMILLTLKQDFGATTKNWQTASGLVGILGKCLLGLTTALEEEEKSDFKEKFLPSAVERMLFVARKAQQRFIKTSKILADTKADLLMYFNNILETLLSVVGAYGYLTISLLKSAWYQQMLMSDDDESVILIMGMLQSANRMSPDVMKTMGDNILQLILDELIYKLSATSNEALAGSATRTLVVICDFQPSFIELVCNRYRGLRPLIKKWEGKGFDRDLRRLTLLLESGNAQQAELKRLEQAAVKIQATWKSYYTRKKLKKADMAFAKFQRSFRAKKIQEEQIKEEERLQKQLHHQLVLRRRKAMRDLHTKRLHALEIIPSKDVNKYLEKEQQVSATKIQARFRGYRVRKLINEKRHMKTETQAAIKIQRGVRRWLKRLKARRAEPPAWQRPPGLSDQRRVELLEHITQYRQDHPPKAKTEEERIMLHDKVQSLLRQHAMKSRMIRKKEQHRNTVLGLLELDANLLADAPKLEDADEKDIMSYMSHSVPIATKARQNHVEELKRLNQPWWKKLADEDEDFIL